MDIAGKNVLVFGSGISGIGAAGLLEERGASCDRFMMAMTSWMWRRSAAR